MTSTQTLQDLASIIRSKNAGPYRLTLDILFRDEDRFQHVVQTGAVSRESVAQAYGVPLDHVTSLFVVPRRPRDQGHPSATGCPGRFRRVRHVWLPAARSADEPSH